MRDKKHGPTGSLNAQEIACGQQGRFLLYHISSRFLAISLVLGCGHEKGDTQEPQQPPEPPSTVEAGQLFPASQNFGGGPGGSARGSGKRLFGNQIEEPQMSHFPSKKRAADAQELISCATREKVFVRLIMHLDR